MTGRRKEMNTLLLANRLTAYMPSVLVTFNGGLAKQTVKGFIDPITQFLIWAVPLVSLVVCLVGFINWFVKDEDEKERHKPFRMIKRIIIVTIIAELINVIYQIFGLV